MMLASDHPSLLRLAVRVLFGAAGCALAGRPPEARAADGAWILTPSLTSQYLFRGERLAGPSLQPALEYGSTRFTAGVWSSVPLQHERSDDSAWELDLYGVRTWTLVPERLDLLAGAALYTFPGANRRDGQYSARLEPSLGVNYVAAGIRFTPRLYHDLARKSTTAEVSAAFAYPLKHLGTELDLLATAGTFRATDARAAAAPAIKAWGDYWMLGVSLPYQVKPNARVALGLTYAEGRNQFLKTGRAPKTRNATAASRLAVTLSYALTL